MFFVFSYMYCDRKNYFMKGQSQETEDVEENNLGLDVAGDIR